MAEERAEAEDELLGELALASQKQAKAEADAKAEAQRREALTKRLEVAEAAAEAAAAEAVLARRAAEERANSAAAESAAATSLAAQQAQQQHEQIQWQLDQERAARAAAEASVAALAAASTTVRPGPASNAHLPHASGASTSYNALNYTYAQLESATRGFSSKLGEGGFGSVYAGALVSGTQLAVKRLEQDAALGEAAGLPSSAQLQAEVAVLSKGQHPNVVPLLGWSVDGPTPCLVYALMEGGALEDRLARRGSWPPLQSSERVVILSDVARGLAYLHITLQCVHRDVKSANVLLDRGCIGRIGDFGIACKMPTAAHGTSHSTGSMHGTFVYLSPEAKLGETSTKQDSFAYGVLGLEVLTRLPVLTLTHAHTLTLTLTLTSRRSPSPSP